MRWAARLDRLIPDLSATLLRFPVPAVLSLALCVYVNIEGIDGGGGTMVAAGAAAGFLASGAAHLFAEGRGLGRGMAVLLALAAAGSVGLLGYFVRLFDTNLVFLFAGLIPLVMIAPFLHAGARQEALWLFNLRFGLTVLIAALIGILFAVGLSGIVEALNVLFGAGIGDLHEHIWLTAMALVAPIYGLSLMPRSLTEEIAIASHKGALLERGISVLINYIAVPVIAVYALILHAYAVKIGLDRELPKGQIATMVSIFAIGGTAIWLIAWPWRDQGTRLLRLFMRSWFFLLILPAVLLGLAIARRLADYGVTPDRYGVVLVAVWVAALTAYLAIRRNRADMRAIIGAAAVLLLVGSAGPMGANGLTFRSQFQRLIAILEQTGVLRDGAIHTPPKPLPQDQSSGGYSIVYALRDIGALDRLRPLFAGDAKSPFATDFTDWSLAQALTERFGFTASTLPADYLNYSANRPLSLDISTGSLLLGPFQAAQRYDQLPQKPMTAEFNGTTLTILLVKQTITLPLDELMAEIRKRLSTDAATQPPVSFTVRPGVTMVVDSIYGNTQSTPPLSSLRFWLIVPQAGTAPAATP